MSLWNRKKKYGHKGENKNYKVHCQNLSLLCCPVYICFPIEGSWDVPFSYFRELVYHWLIYILFISESHDFSAMANL